jgi:uncharacterized protein YdeI (YjbR/CyaY-like superfamily)
MTRRFFATPEAFRAWLAKHHQTATELWAGYYKRDSGKPSMTWPESVDQALCFGWIDGLRKRVDEDSYEIRFTPRKPRGVGVLSTAGALLPARRASLGDQRQAGKDAREAVRGAGRGLREWPADQVAAAESVEPHAPPRLAPSFR